MAERNYPGTLIEVLDGNLANNITIPEDVALIIDRASTGPVGRLYYVTSAKDASVVYGSDSPLIKGMQRAFLAGAKNVALYRVGGRVASIENIFGLGTGLSTAEASSVADVGYSVYIGPEPLNPAVDTLFVYKNNKIIYSNALNGEVDQALVEVDGFDKVNNQIYVGSYQNPVPFAEVVKEAIKNGTMLKNKEFTVIQKLAIADATGDENGWITVMNNGCWYDVEIKERTGESGIAEYYLDYILVYAKGDWVRKVVGSHNLV